MGMGMQDVTFRPCYIVDILGRRRGTWRRNRAIQ